MPDTVLTDALPSDLHYVDDTQPGITRKKLRGKFSYFEPSGQRITDPDEIKRINALAVPPAYTDVWICADPRGHLQATGRDARGRKQYRYHARWREVRDADKYSRLREFGLALPKLRKQLEALLAAPGFSRDKVMATVITLLDATLIRVGNTQYARDNRSYGLTTLRSRHVEVNGSAILFQFRGKSGIEHQITVKDRRLARIIKRCLEIPGQNLFQYLDENGERHTVSSSDVNAYLQTLTGADFTAKDYRTWAGSALALAVLRELHWRIGDRSQTPCGGDGQGRRQTAGQHASGVPQVLYPSRCGGKIHARRTGATAPSASAQRAARRRSGAGDVSRADERNDRRALIPARQCQPTS